ncbi:amino acid ABC transporter substrate-binding protein [Marinimicrococcus flavescens]|uniref:Amino acid ABC transporter substrate-binding protein n=1 Tax=Marinimicrococcus flavescens TaxID=3031815 RepID=A0AAP4D5Z0_9PROT|nr:amino acid ABC transporter substrate-binding protein [Marinimicrococcus flavescens]
MMRYWIGGAAMALAAGALPAPAQAGEILDRVKERGTVRCAVFDDQPGLATLGSDGSWVGFDVDYCRAFAAAIFGDPEKAEIVKMNFAQSFPALQSGEVDVANMAITYTLGRDAEQGYDFVGPTLYNGMGFMVHKELGITRAEQLDGATICLTAGTLLDAYLSDWFGARNMTYQVVAVEQSTQRYQMYEAGRCDVVTTELPLLAARRSRMQNPDAHVILEETFIKSHMGPLIVETDPQWSNVMRWTHYALINAEEYGISQANIDEVAKSTQAPDVRRFLGLEEGLGAKIGLHDGFAADIVRAVGNYNDIWERNFGMSSALKLPRGMNALAQDGGLQWAPTWR